MKQATETILKAGTTPGEAAPLTTPIYETTTYLFENAEEVVRYNEGGSSKYLYTRYGNPTVASVEEAIAALEGAESAALFSSGQAATASVLMTLLSAGDEILCGSAVYGGTLHLIDDVLTRFGVKARFISIEELAAIEDVASPATKVVWFESPINPTLRCVDIAAVGRACRARGITSIMDNTFASPVNQQPLALGVDLVMHSATKYLNGHSDVTAGVIAGPERLVSQVEAIRRRLGTILDPYPAYALGRGLKTLTVRVAQQNRGALAVARWLDADRRVTRVYYPGLESHPDHALAARQMSGFGGMICIDLDGDLGRATRFFDRLRVFRRAASLGGVESLCSLPVLTSQWGHTDAQLEQAGVTHGMARLSVGLEDPADLIADLDQALG